jgi:hypothetical protein
MQYNMMIQLKSLLTCRYEKYLFLLMLAFDTQALHFTSLPVRSIFETFASAHRFSLLWAPQYPLPVCKKSQRRRFHLATKKNFGGSYAKRAMTIHPRARTTMIFNHPAHPLNVWLTGWEEGRDRIAPSFWFAKCTMPTPRLHKRLKMRLCAGALRQKRKESMNNNWEPCAKRVSHTHRHTMWAPRIKILALKWNENKRAACWIFHAFSSFTSYKRSKQRKAIQAAQEQWGPMAKKALRACSAWCSLWVIRPILIQHIGIFLFEFSVIAYLNPKNFLSIHNLLSFSWVIPILH